MLWMRECHRLDSPQSDTGAEFGVQDILRDPTCEKKQKEAWVRRRS